MPTAAKIVSDAIRTSQELGTQIGMDTSEVGIAVVEELQDAATACEVLSPSVTIFRGAGWEIKLRVTHSWEMH